MLRSMARVMESNRELSNRLIDIALQNDDDIFDAAFGEPGEAPVGRLLRLIFKKETLNPKP